MSGTIADDEPSIINSEEQPPHPADDHSSAPQLVSVCMADVIPENVEWLWPGRLAVGKLTLIIGDPGLGKSWVTLYCAAQLSRGRAWADGTMPPVVTSLLITAEDGVADTIRPRLNALDADCSRVHHASVLRTGKQERAIQLADIDAIEKEMVKRNAGLLVLDPVSAYLGKTDSHRDADVRGLLAPLAAVLEKRRAAGLVVMHLRKNTNGAAIHRAGGSIGFVGAARMVLAVAQDPEDEDGERRLLAPVKQNLTKPPDTLAFSIDDGQLLWSAEPVDVDIDTILAGRPKGKQREEHQSAAEEFLRELLADESRWPFDRNEAIRLGEAAGIKERTLRYTAHKIGIWPKRQGFGPGSHVRWHRPDTHTGKESGQ